MNIKPTGHRKQVTISPLGMNSSRFTALNLSKDMQFDLQSTNTMKEARDQKSARQVNESKSPDKKNMPPTGQQSERGASPDYRQALQQARAGQQSALEESRVIAKNNSSFLYSMGTTPFESS